MPADRQQPAHRSPCEHCGVEILWLPMADGSGWSAFDPASVPTALVQPAETYALTRRGVVPLAGRLHPPEQCICAHPCQVLAGDPLRAQPQSRGGT
ncbi:hypothetical protein [Jatrophihabitans lederbergiae]|uniref:Ferredoxin n=1 Tax=Jatrophihabitans lederbergiae TaxID=3075547 RepID=A0ABU2J6L9_9ACTN|nr:hypothetical protein [Jatrophihabitans sp. DSM 44399]MDT0260641.1 hypothetical protein [Jatrophihabitans sp. DSM 44399]